LASISQLRPHDLGFGRLFAQLGLPLLVVERSTRRILLANPAAERLCGYGPGELAGTPLEGLLSAPLPDMPDGTNDLISSRLRTRDGAWLEVELSINPLRDGNLLIAVRDVTERSRQMRQRGDLLDLVEDAIFVRDLEAGTITYWNRSATRLYGWSADEAFGRVSHELLKTVFSVPRDAVEAIVLERGTWEGELVHTARNGQRISVCSHWALQRDEQGKPLALLEANTDVSERKRAEEQLREHATLLDLVPDAIFVREFATGKISYWNRGAEELYGWSQAEALGKCSYDLLRARLPRSPSDLEAELAVTGQWEGEVEHVTRDERHLIIATRWAIRYDEDGRPRDVLAINNDLTQRKKDAAELTRLEAAGAALRERDQLLATVSHDLKTPLTAIRGQADLLLRALDREGTLEPDRTRKGLELLRTAATRMGTWIDDLLDTARLDAGRGIELHRIAMDLIAMTWQAVLEHQRNTERHQLRIETSESRIIGVWDPIRLRRVLDNLLSNAIKYSPDGGEILVVVSVNDQGEAVLCVRDRGVGIPASELPHIFERYRRAANVVGRFAGSGIGLSGVCQIVQEHGGRIQADSNEVDGTTFTVSLPLIAQSVSA
jgi:PAS domain S-box-containing protein